MDNALNAQESLPGLRPLRRGSSRTEGSPLDLPAELAGTVALDVNECGTRDVPVVARLNREQRRESSRYLRRTMSWLHEHSARVDSQRQCQRLVVKGGNTVVVEVGDSGEARARGLQACGSVWSCPRCAPVKRVRRARGLQKVINDFNDSGHRLVLLTLTLPHRAGEWVTPEGIPDARGFFDTVSKAWGRLASGKAWADFKAEALHGAYRAVEATWNLQQRLPHAHIHAVLIFKPGVSDERIIELLDGRPDEAQGGLNGGLRRRWLHLVEMLCSDIDSEKEPDRWAHVERHAFDWKWANRSSVGEYLVKIGRGPAAELVGTTKRARTKANVSTWDLLDGAVQESTGDRAFRGFTAAWRSWERAAEGHLMLTASGDVPSVSDIEAIADELAAQPDDPNDPIPAPKPVFRVVAVLDKADWHWLVHRPGWYTARVLDCAADLGDGFSAWCETELSARGTRPLPLSAIPAWLDSSLDTSPF